MPEDDPRALDLTALDPPGIDEAWAMAIRPAAEAQARASKRLADARRYLKAGGYHRERGERIEAEATAMMDEAMARYRAASAPFDEEYERRGGWPRYLLVCNSNGHVHTSPHRCSTIVPGSTMVAPVYELSGASEAEVVARCGTSACTRCFPAAPVETRVDRERRSAEARQAKAAERAAKAAAQAVRRAEREARARAKGEALLAEFEQQPEGTDMYQWFYSDARLQRTYGETGFGAMRDMRDSAYR